MSDYLITWLSKELEARGWSYRELARRADISHALVSKILSGDMKASADASIRIANALDESPEKVLRLAAILPSDFEDSSYQELIDLIKNLTPDKRREALRYIRFLYRSDED